MNRTVWPVVFLISMIAGGGCNHSSGREEAHVGGNVTFQGTPVETGRILFREMQGSQQAFSGEIKNGKFLLTTSPGKMRVEITASRPVPDKFDYSNGEPTPVGEMYLPPKYNAESELTADISAGKKNSLQFDLTE